MPKVVLIIILVVLLLLIIFAIAYLAVNSGKSPISLKSDKKSSFEVDGVKIQILSQGSGEEAKKGDTITVNYKGILDDGKVFDSSYDRNMPFTFTVGDERVIKGWNASITGMKVGEKRKAYIPAELAYGKLGVPPIIPPNSNLTFEIELMTIKGK